MTIRRAFFSPNRFCNSPSDSASVWNWLEGSWLKCERVQKTGRATISLFCLPCVKWLVFICLPPHDCTATGVPNVFKFQHLQFMWLQLNEVGKHACHYFHLSEAHVLSCNYHSNSKQRRVLNVWNTICYAMLGATVYFGFIVWQLWEFK